VGGDARNLAERYQLALDLKQQVQDLPVPGVMLIVAPVEGLVESVVEDGSVVIPHVHAAKVQPDCRQDLGGMYTFGWVTDLPVPARRRIIEPAKWGLATHQSPKAMQESEEVEIPVGESWLELGQRPKPSGPVCFFSPITQVGRNQVADCIDQLILAGGHLPVVRPNVLVGNEKAAGLER
jgi:hypothetical protein